MPSMLSLISLFMLMCGGASHQSPAQLVIASDATLASVHVHEPKQRLMRSAVLVQNVSGNALESKPSTNDLKANSSAMSTSTEDKKSTTPDATAAEKDGNATKRHPANSSAMSNSTEDKKSTTPDATAAEKDGNATKRHPGSNRTVQAQNSTKPDRAKAAVAKEDAPPSDKDDKKDDVPDITEPEEDDAPPTKAPDENKGMPQGETCRYGAVKGPFGEKCPLLVAQDTRCTSRGQGKENPLGMVSTLADCIRLAARANASFFVYGKGDNKKICAREDTDSPPGKCVGESCCQPGKFAAGQWDLFKMMPVPEKKK